MPELWLPVSNERADLVIIGSEFEGYEIKSPSDTFKRLPRQAAAYARVFDRCVVVVPKQRIEAAMEIVPSWWGAVGYDMPGATFREVRVAEVNLLVDEELLVRLLWKGEVRGALERVGIEAPVTASREVLWKILLAEVEPNLLRSIVREALLTRDLASARFGSHAFRASLTTQ